MTIENINEYYTDIGGDVVFDNGTLSIYVDDREVLTVDSIDKADAISIAMTALHKFDFSYHLEFKNFDEAYTYLTL